MDERIQVGVEWTRRDANIQLYSFTLMAPPVPLAELEGALEQQSQTLREELSRLRAILDARP